MPPAQPIAPPAHRARRWRRWTLLAVVALLVGGLFWAGWYVYNRGFTRKWRDQLTAELRRRGFDMTYSRLTLNPFEGLVIEEAHLYLLDPRAPNGHGTHLLYFKRAAVDLSLANLIQKKPFLNSLDLRDARLTMPVDLADPSGPSLRLRHFDAKLAILPGEVRLTQAQGDFYGVQVTLSGTLLHPGSYNPGGGPATPAEQARRRQLARTIIDEIQKVRSDRSPPRLDIRFQGDLAQPGELRADALLQAEAVRRGGCLLDRVLVRADYAAGAFHLQQVELADARGALAAQGDYNPTTGETRFQLQSSLDLLTLAREFADLSVLHDFTFRDAPLVRLEGRTRSPQQASAGGGAAAPRPLPASNDSPAAVAAAGAFQLTGHLVLGRFAYQKFAFDQGETDFSWSGDRWYLRGLKLTRPPGGGSPQIVNADVLSEPDRARVRLTSTFDPIPFLGLLPAGVREAAARLEFRDPPRVELTATGRSLQDVDGLHADGQLTLGHTRYRGVGINRLHGDFSYNSGLATARHVLLERDEGNVTADALTYEFSRHELRLDNLRSNLDVGQVGVWLDPDVFHTIQPFHFRRPPTAVLNGSLQFEGGRNSHLVTDVSAPAGMEYVFLKKTLPFQSVAGQVVFNEERLLINDVRAGIFDGEAQGGLNLTLSHSSTRLNYSADIDLKNVDFTRVTKLYFDYDNSKGRLSGNYHFTGKGEDAATLHGVGTLNVEHGNVFAIPFLGPLSTILGTVMPGLGFDEAHRATGNFLTDHGKINTGNLDVKGVGFSLLGKGWLGYMNDTMNFHVRMAGRGLPGAVLYPMSKLFEYSSQGPLNKPVWHPSVLTVPATGEERTPGGAPPTGSAAPAATPKPK